MYDLATQRWECQNVVVSLRSLVKIYASLACQEIMAPMGYAQGQGDYHKLTLANLSKSSLTERGSSETDSASRQQRL
jgi:hypothetical protein